jgi:hypothetical protein
MGAVHGGNVDWGRSWQTSESSPHLRDQESLDAKFASDCCRNKEKGSRKVILWHLFINRERKEQSEPAQKILELTRSCSCNQQWIRQMVRHDPQ